eukprot:gene1128-1685_t
MTLPPSNGENSDGTDNWHVQLPSSAIVTIPPHNEASSSSLITKSTSDTVSITVPPLTCINAPEDPDTARQGACGEAYGRAPVGRRMAGRLAPVGGYFEDACGEAYRGAGV